MFVLIAITFQQIKLTNYLLEIYSDYVGAEFWKKFNEMKTYLMYIIECFPTTKFNYCVMNIFIHPSVIEIDGLFITNNLTVVHN